MLWSTQRIHADERGGRAEMTVFTEVNARPLDEETA